MKRILIVRTSAIGDVVFASPFAAALRRTYPDAHITWLIEPGINALIAHDPNVDTHILWPKDEWRKMWKAGRRFAVLRALLALRRQLHAQRFDTAIDLQGLLKSGLLTWLSGARRRIGLGSREGSQWLMTETLPRGSDDARISSEYLHLAQQLQLDCNDFMPRLHVSPAARDKAMALLVAHGLQPGSYAVFAAFTTRPQKHWTSAAWVHLAALLQQRTGLVPVLLGSPAECDAAAAISAAAPGLVNLAGQTGLAEAAAVVSLAGALIGVDTGLTHMGIAFSIPTVALFGSTCPYTVTGRANARVIFLELHCSPCRRNPTCGGRFNCMTDITPERAMQELSLVWKRVA